MNGLTKKSLMVTIAIVCAFIFLMSNEQVYASGSIPDGNATGSNYDPRDVHSSVKNKWVNGKRGFDITRGGKSPASLYTSERGNWLAYDVYTGASSNSLKRGLRVVTENGERILKFNGWAANIGYSHHTRDNQATYIGLVNKKDRTDKKIYKAKMTALHPHTNRDIYYVNTSGPEFCGTNAMKQGQTVCNMKYHWTGFEASIPLKEVFEEKEGEWELYIIKNVRGNLLREELILGSGFDSLRWNDGDLNFSSGQDTNKLIMVNSGVARRINPGPRTDADSGKYFQQHNMYTTVRISEANGVPVWYGVRSPHDGNSTRYTGSMYWQFGGDVATLSWKKTHVDVKINHVDKDTNNLLDTESKSIKIGSNLNVQPRANSNNMVDKNGFQYIADPKREEQRFNNKITANRTIKFTYRSSVDITVQHIDAKSNKLLDSEEIEWQFNSRFTRSAEKRGTFKDADGNPYVAVPKVQSFSEVLRDDQTIQFYYKAVLPDPSGSHEFEGTTSGVTSGEAFWELRRNNLNSPSVVYAEVDFDLEGKHYATRNILHSLQLGDLSITSSVPIARTIDADLVKNESMGYEYSYQFTNYYYEIYKCIDKQDNDCFEWEFDRYEPDWSKVKDYSLADKISNGNDLVTLNVDHRQGDKVTGSYLNQIISERFLVGRSNVVESNSSTRNAYYEQFENITKNMKNKHDLKTQIMIPIMPDTFRYRVEVPSIEHENEDYNVFKKELSSGFYYPVDVDGSLKQKYANHTADDNENDYVFPLQQSTMDRVSAGVYDFEYVTDNFYMTPSTGFIVSYPYAQSMKNHLANGTQLPSFNSMVISAMTTLQTEYLQATGQQATEDLMHTTLETIENKEKLQRYALPISPDSTLRPDTLYTNDIVLENMGLNDLTFEFGIDFSFEHYLFGSGHDEAWIIEQQDPRVPMDGISADQVNGIVIRYDDIPELVEVIKNRPEPKDRMHKFRTTDADIVQKLKSIVGDWDN